jgi:hypothetical protein
MQRGLNSWSASQSHHSREGSSPSKAVSSLISDSCWQKVSYRITSNIR